MSKTYSKTRTLVECALMIALGTVLAFTLLGLACAVLFYTRRFRNTQKDGKLYNVVSVVLAIMALIYGIMGLAGLLSYFGIL